MVAGEDNRELQARAEDTDRALAARDGVWSGYGSMRTLCAQPAGLSGWSADATPLWLVADRWLPTTLRTNFLDRESLRDQGSRDPETVAA